MGLSVSEWVALLCFCAVGIQYSYQITAEINEMMNNCPRNGGYCINVIPPRPRPPPRRRNQGRRRPGTRTRKGRRRGQNARTPKPDPASLGQQHTRLPAAAGGGRAVPPKAGGAMAPVNQYPQQQPAQQPRVTPAPGPFSFFDNLFGTAPGDPFGAFFGMNMFLRKKRQAPAFEPGEYHERPRIRPNENMFNFLNTHCRKSEFDFGCRNTGGMCCMPHL